MFVLMLLASIAVVTPMAKTQEVKVDVPYNFVAAGKLLHAGTYTFSREPSEGALRLKNTDRKESGILILSMTFESALSDATTLRFERMANMPGSNAPDEINAWLPSRGASLGFTSGRNPLRAELYVSRRLTPKCCL